MMFPRELLDYFEVVGFEVHEENIIIRLNERDRILKPKSGHTNVKNVFLPERKITDFPLRHRKMTLLVKRRRWKDEKSVNNDNNTKGDIMWHCERFRKFEPAKHLELMLNQRID